MHLHEFAPVTLSGELAQDARAAGVRSVNGTLPQVGHRCRCGVWDTGRVLESPEWARP